MSTTEQTGATEGTESETQEVEQQTEGAENENETEESTEDAQSQKDAELPEWARNELTRVRNEAAERRVQLREAQEALSKAKTPEEFEAATTALTEKVTALERQILVNDVASQFDLPPALAARLSGDTEEELKADAKLLAQFITTESDPESLGGGLNPGGSSDESFDPVAASRKARQSRY